MSNEASDSIRFDGYEDVPSSRFTLKHFSLMNSLLTVINQTSTDCLENVLAWYFLEHFEHLEDLNVYDVAEECFTSRSGIRRFCQSIGYDNFSAVKNSAYEWSHHKDFFVSYACHDGYREYLGSSIGDMIEEVNRRVTDEELDKLAKSIHDARTTILIASDFSSMAVRDFQQSMLYMHKIVRLLSDSSGDEELLKHLRPADTVIVISASGNYAQAVYPQLEGISSRKFLITLNRNDRLARDFDSVYYLSKSDYLRKRTVYARYGINYFFDLLYNRYISIFNT